jgi:orotate phosphoribosyltransferase
MDKKELAHKIYAVSHITGTFKLRSGQISDQYFDKYLFEARPDLLAEITDKMVKLVPAGTEVIAGLELGGVPLSALISIKTGLPGAFVRKAAKNYGTCKLAEGADIKGKKVCIIEDVVTTGGQIIMSVNELRKMGAVITDVLCVILRGADSRALLAKEGLNLIPLLTMEELEANK